MLYLLLIVLESSHATYTFCRARTVQLPGPSYETAAKSADINMVSMLMQRQYLAVPDVANYLNATD